MDPTWEILVVAAASTFVGISAKVLLLKGLFRAPVSLILKGLFLEPFALLVTLTFDSLDGLLAYFALLLLDTPRLEQLYTAMGWFAYAAIGAASSIIVEIVLRKTGVLEQQLQPWYADVGDGVQENEGDDVTHQADANEPSPFLRLIYGLRREAMRDLRHGCARSTRPRRRERYRVAGRAMEVLAGEDPTAVLASAGELVELPSEIAAFRFEGPLRASLDATLDEYHGTTTAAVKLECLRKLVITLREHNETDVIDGLLPPERPGAGR